MKILIIVVMAFLLTGCGNKAETVAKIDDMLLNMFPANMQLLIEDVNPDLVTMKYLIKNADQYETEIFTDRNDFFVFVKGIITKIDVTDYSKEDLSIMENQEMADLLKNTISYDIYLDNTEEPLSKNIQDGDYEPRVEEGKEYYFMINVTKIAGEYSYGVLEIFNFN